MTKKQKKMLTRILVCAVMLIALQFLPITGIPRFALYLAAYLVIGFDILKKAAKAAFLKTKKDAFGRLFALCSSNPLEKTAEKWYIVLVKMCHYTLIVGDDAFFQGGYRSCT